MHFFHSSRGSAHRSAWRVVFFLAPLVFTVHRPSWGRDLTPPMGRPATERKHFQGDQLQRAGNPQCISPLAKPTESPREFGYYVGGGARERSRHADHRLPSEGVWGTDYLGILIPKHVNLGWWHGRRAQGGSGSYGTDGPRVLHRP
jgi:hypothetical protein